MQIGYLGPMPPEPGGIAQHGFHLLAAFREEGHRTTAVGWLAAYPGSGRRGRASGDDDTALVHRVLKWWSPASWARAGRELKESDLLVVQYVHPFHAIPLSAVMRRADAKRTVVVAHNLTPHEWFPLARNLARLALKRADAVVVHSKFVGSEIAELDPDKRLIEIPMPPLIPVERQESEQSDEFRLLFLGYVRPYKGLGQLLEAVRIVRDGGLDVTLTVAGEFWGNEEAYRSQVDDLGLTDAVTIDARYLSDEEVGSVLASHHALVAPYQEASQSGVVPLALASGRPALVTDVGGLTEQVDDGVNGLVVPSDAEGLAAGIRELMSRYPELTRGAELQSMTWHDFVASIVEWMSTSP